MRRRECIAIVSPRPFADRFTLGLWHGCLCYQRAIARAWWYAQRHPMAEVEILYRTELPHAAICARK